MNLLKNIFQFHLHHIIPVDRCPMYFNDGEDPWTQEENYIRAFDFSGWSSADHVSGLSITLVSTLVMIINL